MPAEIKKEIELEIGHVLFIDIVGYSKLLIDEQRDYLHTLNEVVRRTDSFRAADAAGKLTRLPTGDGMALVFATTPDAPVSCAIEISNALRSHPELRVRMGIHSGPVSGITDVNDRSNVAGAGINLAQRVMDCGDAGHILLSKHVADDLEQYRQWRSHLHDLGECEVKHDVRVHVVNLYTDELGNRELPEKFQQAKATLTAPATCCIRWRSLLDDHGVDRRANHRCGSGRRSGILHFFTSNWPESAAFCKRTDSSSGNSRKVDCGASF